VIYGWLGAGVLVLVYFLATDRSRIARTGMVFEEQAVGPSYATTLKRMRARTERPGGEPEVCMAGGRVAGRVEPRDVVVADGPGRRT